MVQETGVQSLVESYQRLKKMVLDAALLNTHHYKVRIKDKVEQSRERSSVLPCTSVLQLLKREPSVHPRLQSPTLLTYMHMCVCTIFMILFFWICIHYFVRSDILLLIYWCKIILWFGFFVKWYVNHRGLFDAKVILLEEQQCCYLTHSWEDKGIHSFPTQEYLFESECNSATGVWTR